MPAIEALRARFDVPLSVDTWRASVAKTAYAAGAVVGNDISGFADPEYLPVALPPARRSWRPTSGSRPASPIRSRSTTTSSRRWSASALTARLAPSRPASRASASSSTPASISARPSRSRSTLLRATDALAALGYPVLLSASNKRFLGVVLDLDVDDRREATIAAHAIGITLGARILRAHDVRGARRTADVMAALLDARARDLA